MCLTVSSICPHGKLIRKERSSVMDVSLLILPMPVREHDRPPALRGTGRAFLGARRRGGRFRQVFPRKIRLIPAENLLRIAVVAVAATIKVFPRAIGGIHGVLSDADIRVEQIFVGTVRLGGA